MKVIKPKATTFNISNLSHPRTLWSIHTAMMEAVQGSYKNSIGWAAVENKHGKEILLVRHVRSPKGISFLMFVDTQHNDVTANVLKALRNSIKEIK